MSLLVFAYRKYEIIRQKNDLNYRIMSLTRKLNELQQYAANIGDGTVSMQDIMNMPASMFNRAAAFMAYSHNGALKGAQQNMQMMGPQIQFQMQQMQQMSQGQNANSQQMYQQWIFQNLYKQELQKYQKHEEKLLNQQEQEIQQEKARLEAQLRMLEAEYESTAQAEKQSVNFWKPEYTA